MPTQTKDPKKPEKVSSKTDDEAAIETSEAQVENDNKVDKIEKGNEKVLPEGPVQKASIPAPIEIKPNIQKTKTSSEDSRKNRFRPREDSADFWVPTTRLGKMVKDGEITTMKDALATGLVIREPEIVDILLPELDDEVLDVNMVQRMTDSGRRVRFLIMTVVGNGNGYVGLGSAKGKEVGPAIRKAIDNAKLNIIEIRRGCGSWECGCGASHSLPFSVNGKSGSTEVTFRPAPRGVGLAVGDVAKHILRLSGIKDAWGFTRGQTRTTINYSKAVFIALRNSAKLKTTEKQIQDLNITSGIVEIETPVSELTEQTEKTEG